MRYFPGEDKGNLSGPDVQCSGSELLGVSWVIPCVQVGLSYVLGLTVSSVEDEDTDRVRRDIEVLLYLHAGAAIVLTALIVLYFPR